MLVKLSSTLTVNPEYVSSIMVNDNFSSVTIRMSDGQEHHYQPEYGKSVWETYDRLVKLLSPSN